MFANSLKISVITLLGCLIATCSVFSQTIAKDIAKVNSTFAATEKFAISVKYEIVDLNTSKVTETYSGIIKKNGNSYYRKDGAIISITTPAYLLVVDEENKTIILQRRRDVVEAPAQVNPELIDNVLKLCTDAKRIVQENNITEYEFVYENPNYEKIVIRIDSKINFIKSILLVNKPVINNITGNNDKFAIKIVYEDINLNPNLNSDDFTYKKHLTKQFSTFTLNDAYKNYKFYNYFDEQ